MQTRWAFYPAGTPNIIVTTFVANAFLDWYERDGEEAHLAVASEAAEFLVERLLVDRERRRYFGYVPGVTSLIHNANVLGCALLARAGGHTGRQDWVGLAHEAAEVTLSAQDQRGLWPYGEGTSLAWIDGFHTAYVLDGLYTLWQATGDAAVLVAVRRGLDAYIEGLFAPGDVPKYRDTALYPIDIHCASSAIDLFVRLRGVDDRCWAKAQGVTEWTIAEMWDPEGFFWYQKTRWYTNRIPYIRWSQAHMFRALGSHAGRWGRSDRVDSRVTPHCPPVRLRRRSAHDAADAGRDRAPHPGAAPRPALRHQREQGRAHGEGRAAARDRRVVRPGQRGRAIGGMGREGLAAAHCRSGWRASISSPRSSGWPLERGYGVYFLGARDEVVRAVVARATKEHPRLRVAGFHHGYFFDGPEQSAAVVDAVRAARPDILFVGISSPRKEYWLSDNLAELGVPFSMGVGGSFDVYAGLTRRAPEWMQRVGLEWFYRFAQEPTRMWRRYLLGNAEFLRLVYREYRRNGGR